MKKKPKKKKGITITVMIYQPDFFNLKSKDVKK